MKELWSKRIREAVPYVPGEQPKEGGFIKLNTNENPYPPSPKALEALKAQADGRLRLYPDPGCTRLREAIAAHHGVDRDWVFCGNGSDEVLAFAFQAFFDGDRPVTFADITYSFYEVYAGYFGVKPAIVPLKEDFSLPIEPFLAPSGGAVIANPNAPTGMGVALEDIERILSAQGDRVVVVDEAYVDFGGTSAAPLLDKYPNLLIVRTLSKSRSLAGLRVGYCLGHPNLMAGMACVRDSINSYTVDRMAQAVAAAAMADEAYFQATRQRVTATRERTAERLRAMGFTLTPSQANFLFLRHPGAAAKDLLDGLRERKILARWFDRPRIRDYLRVSVGTEEEMEALCAALEELLG